MPDVYAVVVRVDGTIETFTHPVSVGEIGSVIGDVDLAAYTIAAPCPPSASLTMLVDDDAYARGRGWNPVATSLYSRRWDVLGDVAVVNCDGSPLHAEHVATILAAGRILTG